MPLPNPRYVWPDGKRCAAVFSVDVDAESPLLWRLRGQPVTDLTELEQRRFALRAGLGRLVELLGEHGLRGSFYVPGWTAAAYPDVLPALAGAGHEVGLHGYHHEPVHELDGPTNAAILDRSVGVFREQLGRVPPGYRSPAWALTPELHGLLRAAGVAYDSSLMGLDLPYTLEGLVEVPVQWVMDDAVYFRYVGGGRDAWPPQNPVQVAESWREEFEGQREVGGLFMITVHPWLAGRAQRLRLLRGLIRHILAYSDVWWATAGEVAEYHARSVNADALSFPLELPDTNF